MTTSTKKALFLIRDVGLTNLENRDKLYSAVSQAQPIKNIGWISVKGYSSSDPLNISISEPEGVIVGEHMGRVEMTMTDIINQSPKLLEEIKKAREGLKHETLLDDKDVFGK
ncbi:hypothetical protein HY772_03900 [Candidatus Woesearchaeota archaeon]|nr:hypothetical protein [Candidatus Woesearchaeota archaeon]